MKQKILQTMFAMLVCAGASAQVNSGSNGSDGALDFSSINYTTNIVINMADHPNGMYQDTYVNIPYNGPVTYIPNANNSPVTWLAQNSAVINGVVNVSANLNGSWNQTVQTGGPGGYRGGNGGTAPSLGQGPGGGGIGGPIGGNASFASVGDVYTNGAFGGFSQGFSGLSYGNTFLVPLIGGSGGGGSPGGFGGGGGGAILIAASGTITLNGLILANGSAGGYVPLCYIDRIPQGGGGAGSGGGT